MKAKKQSEWQNRIIGYDEKPASWFLANEANWRIHPKNQQESLGDVLEMMHLLNDVGGRECLWLWSRLLEKAREIWER